MKLSFSLEHTDRAGIVRGMIWNTLEHGYRPVTLLHDVAEGDEISVRDWLIDFYSEVNTVRLGDGTLEDPDCLTLWEAAEAAMVPRQTDP